MFFCFHYVCAVHFSIGQRVLESIMTLDFVSLIVLQFCSNSLIFSQHFPEVINQIRFHIKSVFHIFNITVWSFKKKSLLKAFMVLGFCLSILPAFACLHQDFYYAKVFDILFFLSPILRDSKMCFCFHNVFQSIKKF